MITDQPITTAKDDLLGRAAFARQVASAMLAGPADAKGSFCIGLLGGWGAGKTSVINMVVEALLEHGGKNPPVLIQCNPWLYPAPELLPGQLLRAIAAELMKPSRSERLRKAGKAMEKYADALKTCPVECKTETVAELREESALANQKKKGKKTKTLQERRDKVCKHLLKQEETIYVVMDDIDRLSSRRIRHALQLANAVAGFPRVVYLLSFDQEVVAGALGKELNASGWEYLKKFIQVQFTIPMPESGRLREILSAYFDAWFTTQLNLNYDAAYFAEISPSIFACITSIRDIYRFVNTFRYRYQALGNEVNFADLLAITALQLHAPQALPWMQDHRDDLLRGGGLAFHSADAEQKKKLKQEHQHMLAELSGGDTRTLATLIGRMFPRYGRNVLDVKSEDFEERYVRMRRICCEEFFDLYFTQSTQTLTITQREIMRTIHEMDAPALRQFTDGLSQEERRNAYITHLPHYLQDIPREKLPMFFSEAVWLSRLPEGKTPKDKPFQRSFFHECCYCALRILTQMDDGMRKQSLHDAVAEAQKDTVPILVTLLQRIVNHNPDAEAITLEDSFLMAELRQLLSKIQAIAVNGDWLDAPNPIAVLEFWKQADGVTLHVYLQKLLGDDASAARLISSLVQRFDHGMNMEYQYGDINGMHALSDEFPREKARAAVLRLRGTEALRALPEDVQLDCVAFALMDAEQNRVAHQDVLEALPNWLNDRPLRPTDDDDDEFDEGDDE